MSLSKQFGITVRAEDVEITDVLPIDTAPLSVIVDMLDGMGGDIKALADKSNVSVPMAIFQIEKRLLECTDANLKDRWDKSIELFHVTRMRLLQRNAIQLLENIEKEEDKPARIHLAYAKLVLGDLLVASTAIAKQKAITKVERNSTLDAIEAEMDEEEE